MILFPQPLSSMVYADYLEFAIGFIHRKQMK